MDEILLKIRRFVSVIGLLRHCAFVLQAICTRDVAMLPEADHGALPIINLEISNRG